MKPQIDYETLDHEANYAWTSLMGNVFGIMCSLVLEISLTHT